MSGACKSQPTPRVGCRDVNALAFVAALGGGPGWLANLMTLVAIHTADGAPLSGAWS